MAEKYWDRFNEDDRALFAKFLAPLVVASRDRQFTKAEATTYMLTLADVPRDILALGVTQLVEQGVTWMPKPGDIKSACADIVDERRAAAARQAKALLEDCPDCHGSGWADVEGPNAVKPCTCKARARQLMADLIAPIARPQIAERSEVDA